MNDAPVPLYTVTNGFCPHLQASHACPLCIRDREIEELKEQLNAIKNILNVSPAGFAVNAIKQVLEQS